MLTTDNGNNLSKKFNFEVPDDVLFVLGDFIVQQQHEESSGHVTQQVAAAVAVHLTETVDGALLYTSINI